MLVGRLLGGEKDEFFANVTFLANFEDAAAGAETFTAEVDTNEIGAIAWNATSGNQPSQVDGEINNTTVKFGNHSIYAKESAGASNASWSTTSTVPGSDFSFTGDFTIECHVYITDLTSDFPLFGSLVFGQYQWIWEIRGGTGKMRFISSTADTTLQTVFDNHEWGGGGGGVATDEWIHVAVCRSGSNWYPFYNGVLSDQGVVSNSHTINAPASTNFNIFSRGPNIGAGQIEGYIDNIRITDGVARYTNNFTPPTKPYPLK